MTIATAGQRAAMRVLAVAVIVVLAYGCATTAPPPTRGELQPLRGVASWYGEEFAGRTTANGEIFDPHQLTAAHRTLPFGTVLDVMNPRTGQAVRVRVNDRGPYIGGRVIDLSYAAAQQISLVEPGIGEVEIRVVRVGSGDREPPQPLEVTVAEAPKSVTPLPAVTAAQPRESEPPKVEFPLPAEAPARPVETPAAASVTPQPPAPTVAEPVVREEAVVDRVDVETQRGETVTRRQVSPDGRKVEEVNVADGTPVTPAPRATQPPRSTSPARRASAKQYVVQVGAFAVEANAKALHERMLAIGQRAYIDQTTLWRVRIGPFATRDEAVAARTALEAKGISGIVVTE